MPGSSAETITSAPVDAGVCRGEERIGRHVQADVFHGGQRAAAGEGHADARPRAPPSRSAPTGRVPPRVGERFQNLRGRRARDSQCPGATPASSAASATASSPLNNRRRSGHRFGISIGNSRTPTERSVYPIARRATCAVAEREPAAKTAGVTAGRAFLRNAGGFSADSFRATPVFPPTLRRSGACATWRETSLNP